MQDSIERKRLAILGILKEAGRPVASEVIARRLRDHGFDLSDRTVRFHLQGLDLEGFTVYLPKQGRILTAQGELELDQARVHERLGFLSARIDRLTYRMDFDLEAAKGNLIVNLSLVEAAVLKKSWSLITRVYEAGYSMGSLIGLYGEGATPADKLGISVPSGYLAVATVCSITLNGLLLAARIPVYSRYGGLLEVIDRQATRFISLMTYEGTTVDPLEMFIRARMTDYMGVTSTGTGVIGAGYREVPVESADRLKALLPQFEARGLGAVLTVGTPGLPLLGIPATEGRVGVVVIGGLNPIATLEETGQRVYSRALSTLVPYEDLFDWRQFEARISLA